MRFRVELCISLMHIHRLTLPTCSSLGWSVEDLLVLLLKCRSQFVWIFTEVIIPYVRFHCIHSSNVHNSHLETCNLKYVFTCLPVHVFHCKKFHNQSEGRRVRKCLQFSLGWGTHIKWVYVDFGNIDLLKKHWFQR